MYRDAIINVTTIIQADNDKDTIKATFRGTYEKKDEFYIIKYNENNMFNTDTTIIVGDYIEIIREGEFTTAIVLEKNTRRQCLYHSPYGDCLMGFTAYKINHDLSDSGGNMHLIYTIDTDNSIFQKVEMTIIIT